MYMLCSKIVFWGQGGVFVEAMWYGKGDCVVGWKVEGEFMSVNSTI